MNRRRIVRDGAVFGRQHRWGGSLHVDAPGAGEARHDERRRKAERDGMFVQRRHVEGAGIESTWSKLFSQGEQLPIQRQHLAMRRALGFVPREPAPLERVETLRVRNRSTLRRVMKGTEAAEFRATPFSDQRTQLGMMIGEIQERRRRCPLHENLSTA